MAEETGMQLYNTTQHGALLAKQATQIDKWCLPASNMRSDALIRHALHEMSLDANLQACSPTSIYLALLACAVTGLVPGKMRSLAFLIPYKNTKKNVDANGIGREITTMEATFMRGWRGVKLIGFRAGLDMVSVAVHQNDDFDFDKGSAPFVRYKPALRGAGPVIGTAAWAKLPRGGLEVEYMDLEELGKVEAFATSKGGSAAWSGPFKHEMQRKSALRRLGKQLEMGEDFHRSELLENSLDSSGSMVGALDIITDGEASKALAASTTESMAFGALPAGKPEPARPVQVQVAATVTESTRQTNPGPPRGIAKVAAAQREAQAAAAAANPTPAAASSGAPATVSSQSSQTASSPAPSQSASSVSKLDAAKAVVAAKAVPTASAPPPTAPTPSTASASPESPTETSSSASGEADLPAGEPDHDFDVSFGEDPEDKPAAPAEKSVEAFMAWVASCNTEADLNARKGEWIEWSSKAFTRADPDAIRMQDAFSKRRELVKRGGR